MQRQRLAATGERASRFINSGLAELGPRLGPILWQFPPTQVFDCDDLAGFLDALPRTLEGRPLRHVLKVRHDSFAFAAYVDLACAHGVATVFTDSPDYPSLANISGDFVYARLMRSKAALKTGYAPKAFGEWAKLASQWAAGRDPVTLPHAGPLTKRVAPRELIVFSSAVPSNATRPPPSPCKKGVDAPG